MAYTPVATDGTKPLDTELASTAAAEFRVLKSYIQSTIVAGLAAKAPLASPALTGNPTAPTQVAGNNTTRLATTAFVTAACAAVAATIPSVAGLAPLASPAFTGTPTAPTQAAGNNTTRLATTAFVTTAVADGTPDLSGYAPKASPVFTGNPTAPTPSTADNDTSVATTAYVVARIASDIANKADLANPNFTGTVDTVNLTVSGTFTPALTSNGRGIRTISTAAPSGGADGDIWMRY